MHPAKDSKLMKMRPIIYNGSFVNHTFVSKALAVQRIRDNIFNSLVCVCNVEKSGPHSPMYNLARNLLGMESDQPRE